MNDRFKFRVWDNDFKKYRTGLGINNGLVCTYNDATCILEQCTGLKDKNGKLIYEGDIVKNGKHIYPVEWCVNGFAVNDGYDYLVDNEEWEVIGNIHENTDLIKVGGK